MREISLQLTINTVSVMGREEGDPAFNTLNSACSFIIRVPVLNTKGRRGRRPHVKRPSGEIKMERPV